MMKKIILKALTSTAALLVPGVVFAATVTITVEVSDDAHISQAEPWSNFGSADRMFATQGMDDETTEKIYLMFDLSDLPGEVVDIIDFQAVFRNSFGRAGHTYLLTGPGATDWSEHTITYDNAPANNYNHYGFLPDESMHLGFLELVEQNETASFVWREGEEEQLKAMLVAALNEGDRRIAFGIYRSSTNRNISYASKESTQFHGPRLVLEVRMAPDIGEVVLDVAEDTYINQALPDMNFGSAAGLFATQGIADYESEKIYLKFDASSLPGDVIDILDFQAVFLNPFPRAGWAHLLTGPDANDWGEHAITYNNAPANEYFHYGFRHGEFLTLGYLEMAEQGETASFYWISDSVKHELIDRLNSGDRVASIGIDRSSTNRNLSYASRENPDHHAPRLILLVDGLDPGDPPTGFDAWRADHFSDAAMEDPEISGPLATPAGDEVANLLKYALGLNPWTPSRSALPQVVIEEIGGVAYLVLRFAGPADAEDIQYAVLASGELGGESTEAILVSEESLGDGTVLRTYRDVEPVATADRRFVWLSVQMN